MPIFTLNYPVTLVRNAGRDDEKRLSLLVGGDLHKQALIQPDVEVRHGDHLLADVFDERRVVTAVHPRFTHAGLSHYEATLEPLSTYVERIRTSSGSISGVDVRVTGGHIGVINLGEVQGSINATVQSLTNQGGQHEDLAKAIKELTEAVSNSTLSVSEKKDALEILNTVATTAQQPAAKRASPGTMKAVLAGFSTLIGTAKNVADLWEKYSHLIRSHLGL